LSWKEGLHDVPHPSPQNLTAAWQIRGQFMATAFFAEPRAATPPSRLCRNENLRKLFCHQFAARLVTAIDVLTS
jgi:hypothetical protein